MNATTSVLVSPANDHVLDRIGIDVFLEAVESTRPYVISRLSRADLAGEVDEAMQRIRIAAWRGAERYRSEHGSFGGFVQGIARITVLDEIRLSCRRPTQLPDWFDAPADEPEPLRTLIDESECSRLKSHLQAAMTLDEYLLTVALMAKTPKCEVQAELSLSPRAMRSTRERVTAICWTVKAALLEADNGNPGTPAILRRCIPTDFGLRAVAEYATASGHDTSRVARHCRMSVSEVRRRLPQTRRLLSIARDIIAAEGY